MLSNTVTHITFGEPKIQQHQQQYNFAVENIKNKEDSIATTKVSFVVNSTIENRKQNENITVKKGQEFTIILESNPTTGYQWIPTFNTSIINLVSHNFQPSTTKLMGSPGTDIFKFKATNQGTESLKMIYKRSWEKEFVKEKAFVINVI
jgi:predicted secreted protein